MPTFLVFSLWAPLAAFGDVAVGERRYSLERPGKSAVLGLVAAALGIDRTDEATLRALHDGYGLAVRVDTPGAPMTDFQTAQVPPARKGKRWATRRAELAEPELGTILSWREYRTDARFTVVLWPREKPPYSLERLEQALRQPVFTLYLGRKACPLGAPPAPWCVETSSLAEALGAYDDHWQPIIENNRIRQPKATKIAILYTDAEAVDWLGDGLKSHHRRARRDDVVNRQRWQFRLREEWVAHTVALGDSP
jgi:CRISPR system Cascade subunit CasD